MASYLNNYLTGFGFFKDDFKFCCSLLLTITVTVVPKLGVASEGSEVRKRREALMGRARSHISMTNFGSTVHWPLMDSSKISLSFSLLKAEKKTVYHKNCQ